MIAVPAWAAQALVITGSAIAAVGFVGTARFCRRLGRARRERPQDRKAAATQRLRDLASASNHLLVEGVGLTLLLVGLVLSSSVPVWTVLSGIALTLAAALSAVTLRWAIGRLR